MFRIYYHQTPSEGGGGLVEFTDRVNLSDRNVKLLTNAEQGSVGTSQIVVDDPDGDWATHGHRKVVAYEDEAPEGNQLLGIWYTAGRTVRRGKISERTEVARQWEVELTDINTLLQRRIMAGNDTDRPEETDVERVEWLVGTSEANAFDDVTTLVATGSPVNMSDSDYNGQGLAGILDDCAQQSGKNYFLRSVWDDPDYVIGLWYGHDTVDALLTDVGITNDDAVLRSDTLGNLWLGSEDATLKLDPSRVFSGVFGNYDGGWVYETLPATETEFAKRDTTASWPNVRRTARASARADRYLADLDTEEEVITTKIFVPPADVNDVMAGDEVHVLFTHLPGYEEWRPVRVLARTVTLVTPEVYELELTLSEDGPADGWSPPVPPEPPVPVCYVTSEGPNVVDNQKMVSIFPQHGHAGSRSYQDNVGEGNYGRMLLYEGARYGYQYHIDKNAPVATGCRGYSMRLLSIPSAAILADRAMGGSGTCAKPGIPLIDDATGTFDVGTFGVAGVSRYYELMDQSTSYAGCSPGTAEAWCSIWYIDGPDPRFEDEECAPP